MTKKQNETIIKRGITGQSTGSIESIIVTKNNVIYVKKQKPKKEPKK